MTEQQALQLIDERDAAVKALARAYYIVTGQVAEWSNSFGFDDAVREIEQWGNIDERELDDADRKIIDRALDKIREEK